MYELLIEKRAERDFEKLPRDVQQRIIPQIRSLRNNPWPHGVRKIAGSESDWRIAIGAYRVIYEIDNKNKVVRIFRIRHRRDVYK